MRETQQTQPNCFCGCWPATRLSLVVSEMLLVSEWGLLGDKLLNEVEDALFLQQGHLQDDRAGPCGPSRKPVQRFQQPLPQLVERLPEIALTLAIS